MKEKKQLGAWVFIFLIIIILVKFVMTYCPWYRHIHSTIVWFDNTKNKNIMVHVRQLMN